MACAAAGVAVALALAGCSTDASGASVAATLPLPDRWELQWVTTPDGTSHVVALYSARGESADALAYDLNLLSQRLRRTGSPATAYTDGCGEFDAAPGSCDVIAVLPDGELWVAAEPGRTEDLTAVFTPIPASDP